MSLNEQATQPTPEYRTIPLTQGKVAIVDAEDYERLSQYKWFAYKSHEAGGHTFYARRNIHVAKYVQRVVHMHRQILNAPAGVQVDHRNLNGLDNRKTNLRLATGGQNAHNKAAYLTNRSGYKGVRYRPERRKWIAQISLAGKRIHLGQFETAEAARDAYIDAAKRMHGEFARY